MMFAIVALSLSIAIIIILLYIMDKTQPIKKVINKLVCVCVCMCVYVCMTLYVCVCVFEIEMRVWEDLCRLSQQTSSYMLLHYGYLHTSVCAHISRVPVGLIATFC